MIMKKACASRRFVLKESLFKQEIFMRFAAFFVLVFFAFTTLPALGADYNPKTEIIAEINRAHPLQNPKYETATDILGRRMLDRKNKVVGSIKDIVLNQTGGIAFLDVDFDRMKLGRKVFVNYSTFNVKPVTNGYAMSFDSNEIEEIYPSLLADIESAAGDEDNVLSLSKVQGTEVWNASGERIGTVNNILFGSNGQRAEAVYITLTQGNLRGDGIAVPFSQVNFSEVAGKRRATVADDTAEAMIAFARAG
jgi:sporulation protein YlmC with PRC-barrel domain